MKISLFSAVAALLLFTSCAKKANDLNRYGYKGPVEKITTLTYAGYQGTVDSANFSYRTVYDYNEDGNVHFMQWVMNGSMYNQPSYAVNYTYFFENGKKSGWKEFHVNVGDSSSKGTVEWPDDRNMIEKAFGADGQLRYEFRTTFNDDMFEEDVQIVVYENGKVKDNQKVKAVREDGVLVHRIHHFELENRTDTVFIENLERDDHGNVTRMTEFFPWSGEKNYIHKIFQYRD